jgi:integrase/recombinase XerD
MTVGARWTLDALVDAYTQHCRRTRGLRDRTLREYESFARLFVGAALGDGPMDPTRFRPSAVVAFVASLRGRFSPRSMKTVRTALRSFFRFLRVEGLSDEQLEAAIPTVAYWRLSTLPRSLREDQVAQVLASFDASTPGGRRDRAIILCLSTLGLRPGEVAALCLEDLDWRAGTIHLHTRKTRRGALLPLPREMGRAIVAYLRHARPVTDERRVFVQYVGARRGQPIGSTAVSEVVARALRRAKVDAALGGAYVFRHTLASRLVQQGASLKEVADLRRRSTPSSTFPRFARFPCPGRR